MSTVQKVMQGDNTAVSDIKLAVMDKLDIKYEMNEDKDK